MSEKPIQLKPRRRRRTVASPTKGWSLVGDAAQRLGMSESLLNHVAQRAFAIAAHRLVPRLEPHARAESLELQTRTLTVRVSSSAVASELVYVKDLLLEQVNKELTTLSGVLRVGRKTAVAAAKLERLQYRVAPVKSLPDYAAWIAAELRPPLPEVPRLPWDLEVAAALNKVGDEGTRDALAALYAAATGASTAAKKR